MLRQHAYVEPIVFFTCACTFSYLTIESEFVYQFVSQSHNFTTEESVIYCGDVENPTISASEQAQIVAEDVSRWTKMAMVPRAIANTISVLVITSWSDVIGRRNALLFPVIGALTCSVLLMINIYFRISLIIYVVCGVIYGATGGWTTLINVGSALLSDVVKESDRGQRYTILEVCSALGGGLTMIGTGYWLHQYGFLPPTIFIVCCAAMALLLTVSLRAGVRKGITESGEDITEANVLEDEGKRKGTGKKRAYTFTSILSQLREVYRIYTTNEVKCAERDPLDVGSVRCRKRKKKRVWRLWFYLIAYAIYMAAVDGFDLFMTMFLVSYPLCFTPELVGARSGIRDSIMIFSPLMILFLRNVPRFSDQSILLCAIIGRMANCVVMFLATNATHVFIGTAFGIVSSLTTPLIRAQVSNLVSPTEQGPVLALVPCASKIVNTLSPIIILSIYTATLYIRHSFIWAVMAIYFMVAFLLMGFVWIADKIHDKHNPSNDKKKQDDDAEELSPDFNCKSPF